MAINKEQWLEKIAALLANADDPALTPEARAAYHAKANQLLVRFGLEESDARNVGKQQNGLAIVTQLVRKFRDTETRFAYKEHRTKLAQAVARMCMVKRYLCGTAYLMFVGTTTNVDTAIRMYQQLDDEIERRLETDANAARKRGVFKQVNPTTWRTEYRDACVETLYYRVITLVQEQQAHGINYDDGYRAEPSQVTALVVQHDKLIDEFMTNEYGGTKKYQYKKQKTAMSNDGYYAGRAAGNAIDIQRKIGQGDTE